MTVYGITGHQSLPEEALAWAESKLRALWTADASMLTGVSSLAAGADQAFAEIVCEFRGRLEVVVPSSGYIHTFEQLQARVRYERLLSYAAEVTRMPYSEPGEEAFWAAGQEVVHRCEILIAIWDGMASRGLGGTADVVDYASRQGKEVEVIWPRGVSRS